MRILIFILFPFLVLAQSKPNVIFIYADDLGFGEIGRNNSEWYTPNIDSLAAKGIYFSRYYTPSLCTPSRASLLTGRHVHELGLQYSVLKTYEGRGLDASEKLLPEYFHDAGYYTGAIGKWHLGRAYPEQIPALRGFDYTYTHYGSQQYFDEETPEGFHAVIENGQKAFFTETGYGTESYGAKAVEFINSTKGDQPFFLYVPFLTPHTPIEAPADTTALAPTGGDWNAVMREKWAMVRIMDNEIGKIWQSVIDLGIENETIIIFTSDNGADLGTSPNDTYPTVDGDNGTYYGQKTQNYDGGTRVPMIWYDPGNMVGRRVCDSLTHVTDFIPTLIKGALGRPIEVENDTLLDGVNWYDYTTGDSIYPANRTVLIHMATPNHFAIAKHKFKLCGNCSYSFGSTSYPADLYSAELYYTDTSEVTNVYSSNLTLGAELVSAAADFESDIVPVETIVESEPPGWNDPPALGVPSVFWWSLYYYYRP